MNIENLPRAIKAADELAAFHHNLDVLGKMVDKAKEGKLTLRFHEHSDNSGLCTNPFWFNGNNNHALVEECIKAVFLIVCRYEEELRMEIDEL